MTFGVRTTTVGELGGDGNDNHRFGLSGRSGLVSLRIYQTRPPDRPNRYGLTGLTDHSDRQTT